jgi:hypothetical protein
VLDANGSAPAIVERVAAVPAPAARRAIAVRRADLVAVRQPIVFGDCVSELLDDFVYAFRGHRILPFNSLAATIGLQFASLVFFLVSDHRTFNVSDIPIPVNRKISIILTCYKDSRNIWM